MLCALLTTELLFCFSIIILESFVRKKIKKEEKKLEPIGFLSRMMG
jgi:hypothetical protein